MGWLVGFGGGGMRKKRLSRGGGGNPKKIREKRGGHVKYFSNTLKWHNVLILKKLLLNKRSRKDTNLLQTSIRL